MLKTGNYSNRTILSILGLVMVINALSYGTIIPLLYPYAARFGLSPLGTGLLFSTYSLFQLLATPIIGKLSDRFGRKPLLLGSLFGTSVSLALFASATTVPMLFVARILDGITGGNISVAQAVITDTTSGRERTKSFGIIGASFGVGFLLGPALGGIMSAYSLTAPFWLAASIAFAGSIIGWIVLPETLSNRRRFFWQMFVTKQNVVIVGIKELIRSLWLLFNSFRAPKIGALFMVTLVVMSADQMLSLGFQAHMSDIFKLNPTQIGWAFAGIGVLSIIMQAGGIKWLLGFIPNRLKMVKIMMVVTTIATFLLFIFQSPLAWFITLFTYVLAFIPFRVMMTGLLSDNSDQQKQGEILGINQSILSLGQIIGPLSAGVIASFEIKYIFLVAAGVFVFGLLTTRSVQLVNLDD